MGLCIWHKRQDTRSFIKTDHTVIKIGNEKEYFFLSGLLDHRMLYRNQLCPRQVWRLLNQGSMKCGRINLFGLTTKKSFSSGAPIWIADDLLRPVTSMMMMKT